MVPKLRYAWSFSLIWKLVTCHQLMVSICSRFTRKLLTYLRVFLGVFLAICLQTISGTPSINAQCRSMPIKSWHISQCWSMLMNSDQFWYRYSVDRHWEELIRIDRQWTALRGISDQCYNFDRHWSALGIDPRSPVIDIICGTETTQAYNFRISCVGPEVRCFTGNSSWVTFLNVYPSHFTLLLRSTFCADCIYQAFSIPISHHFQHPFLLTTWWTNNLCTAQWWMVVSTVHAVLLHVKMPFFHNLFQLTAV